MVFTPVGQFLPECMHGLTGIEEMMNGILYIARLAQRAILHLYFV